MRSRSATTARTCACSSSTPARGQGHGHALLKAAEDVRRARRANRSSLVGADAPYFLWPGAPSTETALLCLLESRHYGRVETNFDMDVDLGAIPDDPGGHRLARPGERDEIDTWMARHWSNWRLEVLRALRQGQPRDRARRGDGRHLTAFCAFEVNRPGCSDRSRSGRT